MKNYLLFSLLLLSLLPACKKKGKTVTADNVVFGSFHGMCPPVGCVQLYSVSSNNGYQDTVVRLVNLDWAYHFIPSLELSADKIALTQSLLTGVPEELVSGSERVYGEPDSHDQGGVYLQIDKDGVSHRCRIDNDNSAGVPTQVRTYREKVNNVLRQLN